MSIQKHTDKIKGILRGIAIPLIIILVGTLSFGLGRLSVSNIKPAVEITYSPELLASIAKENASKAGLSQTASVLEAVSSDEEVVASAKGTKYHYEYCPGAKQISEANKIVFKNSEEAELRGYTLAANCKKR